MKKKRRSARRSRSAPSDSPSRASRLGGGRSGCMTERLIAAYKSAMSLPPRYRAYLARRLELELAERRRLP